MLWEKEKVLIKIFAANYAAFGLFTYLYLLKVLEFKQMYAICTVLRDTLPTLKYHFPTNSKLVAYDEEAVYQEVLEFFENDHQRTDRYIASIPQYAQLVLDKIEELLPELTENP